MPDIASLGLQIDSSQVVDGKKALDQFSEASAKADQGARSLNGQMNDTAKAMRAQAEQARATAAANTAMGTASGAASIGAQLFIEKLQEQVAVLGMSRSQLAAYQAAQLGVSKEAEASVAKLKAYEDQIKALADAKAEAAKQSNFFADSIKVLAAAYSALKLGEYVKDAALLAARYETLGVVSTVVGKNAGYTKVQMDTATDAIARQGITMIESRQSAIKLVQAHVDLTNATGLARIAQDAAVIGNLNSSEAFDRLVNGISRGNVLILRNIGINVNLQSAYEQMAASLGKTSKELTENERVQARLNAVIERGADIAGTYEASMDTAGKQLKSMQRYAEDLKTVLGETFNEALTIGVMALTDSLKDANKEVSDLSRNNQLQEWGHGITQVFVSVADTVNNALGAVKMLAAGAGYAATSASIIAQYAHDVAAAGFDADKQSAAYEKQRAAVAANVQLFADEKAEILAGEDKFQKAYDLRSAAMAEKHKAEADARLKIDQDYAAKATALLISNAGKSVEAQQAAQLALAKSVYVGTPNYRDTEGREPKAKVDKVESTELADRLARIQDLVNADKEMYATMSRMEDMFHAAGKMGDEEYYQLQRDHIVAVGQDQAYVYTKQIAELKAYNNATAAEAAKHAKQINDIDEKRKAAGAKMQDELSLLDAKEFLRKEAVEAASDQALNTYLSGLEQEAKKLELSNQAHDTSKGAIERESIARLDAAIAQQQQLVAGQNADTATEKEIAQGTRLLKFLEDERSARARIAAGLDQQQAIQYKDKAADQAIKDWQRAGQSISESLTSAFGEGGKALGGMFQAYAKGMEGQLRAQKDLAAAKKLAEDNPDKVAAINRAQLAGAQSQIQSYAGMTAAAQGFFAEGSRGYQAMHAATVALQGAEIALSLIKGVNAVLTQGEGDPYSAFARMAAMAAIVAGLGVAISGGGGGGGHAAADVQKAQGTGSVFGDSSAKSDSVRRSIEQLTANSSDMLPINQGMLTALQNIESSMTGLTNLVVRTTGLTDGTNMGIQTGTISSGETGLLGSTVSITKSLANAVPLVGGLVSGIIDKVSSLWGKTTQNIIDSGLQYGGSVRGLQAGQGFDQYASIDTTKSSWFGLSKSTSNRVEVQGLNDELSKQFGLIFTNLDKSLQAASVAMGGSAADVTKVLDNLTLESTKVSLKGLTGTALTDALNSVISKSMDEIAQAAFPQLDKFRTVGEGYAETVMRLAGDYAKLDSILAASSTTFGATGMASIGAREHLIELAGGIDQLASQTNTFTQNFLSKAEQLAPVQKYVTDQLAAMGLQSLDTRDKFKDYVLGLANSGALATDAGAQQYTALLALADAFAKTHAATADLTKSEQEIADERTDLQSKLDELTLTQEQLAEKARAAIDGHNLALYDSVQAAEVAQTRRQMEIALMEAQGDKAGALAANRAAELAAMNATLRPLQEQIYAQQDIATAAQETAGILSLQAQMYEATGDKAGAAAVLEQQHEAALVGLSPALAAATQATWAAQAAEKARQEELQRSNALLDIQAQIAQTTGDKAGAAAILQKQHAAALAALDPALRDATTQLWAVQAAAAASKDSLDAVSKAYSAVQSVVGAQKDALNKIYESAADGLQSSIDKVTNSVSNLTSLSDALHSALDSMEVPGQEKADRQTAQAQIAAALAIAKAGGPLPDSDGLKKALATVGKDASGQFGSYLDYQRDLYTTKNNVGALSGYSDAALSTEQLTLKAIKDQKTSLDEAHKQDLARLDAVLEQAKLQSDLLNGTATALMTLPDALKALAAAIGNAQKDPTVGADALTSLYKDLLGRTPDVEGYSFWKNALTSGVSLEHIKDEFLHSPEYLKLHPFAVGTNSVPGDMAALIHQGERIVPAADNRELMARLRSPSADNAELIAEMREMRRDMALLRAAAARTADASEEGTGLFKRVIRNDVLVTKEKA